MPAGPSQQGGAPSHPTTHLSHLLILSLTLQSHSQGTANVCSLF